MGIRFLCPNGHKLNVKNFLAGKRAICPKCGVRVIVPLESERESTSGNTAREAAEELVAEEYFGDESLDESMLAEARKTIVSAAPPAPDHSAVQASGTPQSATTADPVSEAPGAVWYVRPASGGQYGPASGEIIRNWIRDGRVGASSLVWRDGWAEWRSAAATFPELSVHLAAPEVPVAAHPASVDEVLPKAVPVAQAVVPGDAPAAAVPANPLVDAARRRKRMNEISLIASIVLVVVSIILLVVLILVIRSQSASNEPESEPADPAATSVDRLTPISVSG